MKKILTLALALVLACSCIITLASCGEKNNNIGVQAGTTGQYFVDGDADWGFDGLNVQPKGYDNGALAVQDLINGNLDYVIIDADPATRIVDNFNAIG